jgi:hypothetical protein
MDLELEQAEADSLEQAVATWINGNRTDVLETLEDLDPIDAAGMALAIFDRLEYLEPMSGQDFAQAVLRRGADGE